MGESSGLPPLEVVVLRGQELKKMDLDLLGREVSSYAFVEVKLGKAVQRTTVIKDPDPEWNETFRFYPTTRHIPMELTVLDWDALHANDHIGKVVVRLDTMLPDPFKPEDVQKHDDRSGSG